MASTLSQDGSLTTSNTNIKLRGNSGGVPLAHADVDGNFLLLMDAHNDVVSDLAAKAASSHSHSNATTSAAGFMSGTDKSKLDGIATGANNYSLPNATSSVKGGVKVGSNINVSNATISVPTASNTVKGVVKVDNSTITINSSGVISANVSNNTDSQTLSVSGSTLTISGGNSVTLPSGGGSVTPHSGTNDMSTIVESLAGFETPGLMVNNLPATILCYLNDTTGTTNTTARRTYVHTHTGININDAFKNVATAEQYLAKYHSGTLLNVLYVFQTDITDTTLSGYTRPDESFVTGVHYYGQGEIKTWTIQDLGRNDINQIRGRIVMDNMHIKINANSGNGQLVFGCFEGGHILLQNENAIELGTDVYLATGLFGVFNSGFYGEQQRLEIKNNLSTINLCQPIFALRKSLAYTAGINIHSGQFHTARMLGHAEWIQYHTTCGNAGTGGTFAGTDITATSGDEQVGNWWQESGYSYPTGYVDKKYPAFRFEGMGNTVDWGGDDQVLTDVMRYSSVVGQSERFDIPIVGVGMPNPTYSNSSTASNAGIVFNWDSPSGPAVRQTDSIAFGSSPFFMNKIHYPWGANGTDFTQTNYRGWAFPGVSAGLPKKSFTIIS